MVIWAYLFLCTMDKLSKYSFIYYNHTWKTELQRKTNTAYVWWLTSQMPAAAMSRPDKVTCQELHPSLSCSAGAQVFDPSSVVLVELTGCWMNGMMEFWTSHVHGICAFSVAAQPTVSQSTTFTFAPQSHSYCTGATLKNISQNILY